jgi:hypothetical protein
LNLLPFHTLGSYAWYAWRLSAFLCLSVSNSFISLDTAIVGDLPLAEPRLKTLSATKLGCRASLQCDRRVSVLFWWFESPFYRLLVCSMSQLYVRSMARPQRCGSCRSVPIVVSMRLIRRENGVTNASGTKNRLTRQCPSCTVHSPRRARIGF